MRNRLFALIAAAILASLTLGCGQNTYADESASITLASPLNTNSCVGDPSIEIEMIYRIDAEHGEVIDVYGDFLNVPLRGTVELHHGRGTYDPDNPPLFWSGIARWADPVECGNTQLSTFPVPRDPQGDVAWVFTVVMYDGSVWAHGNFELPAQPDP